METEFVTFYCLKLFISEYIKQAIFEVKTER